MSDHVTIQEAMNQLGGSVRWLNAMVDSGRIAHEERDGRRYVSLSAVREALVKKKQQWRTDLPDEHSSP